MAQPATHSTWESLPPGDAELLAASRAGDTTAYATLYERHSASAYTLARYLMRGTTEADDVVNEAFTRVLGQLRRGAGPRDAFRPYLLTTVRRVAFDRFRAQQHQVSVADMEPYDSGAPFVDPAIAGLERHLVARAYFSLPQRWRAVLWHTAVEGARPAEIAELLGVTPNGAAALAYRAREALRQAYLQMHLAAVVRQECRPATAKLGAFVRGKLSQREAEQVAAHLDECADCAAARDELLDVNSSLRGVIGPIIVGPGFFAAAKGAGFLGWLGDRVLTLRQAPKQQQAAVVGAAVAALAVVAALALALALSGAPSKPASRPVPAGVPPAAAPPPAHIPHHAPVARHQHHANAPVANRAAVPLSPTPAPSQAVHHRVAHHPVRHAQLTASINPVGSLLRGGTGIVTFTVADTSRIAAKTMDALITLPAGVSDIGAGSLGMSAPAVTAPGGWSCTPTKNGARCAHGSLSPRETTTSYLQVAVAPDAPVGAAPVIRVTDGGQPVRGRGLVGVAAGGLPARYAASGSDASVVGYGSFGRRHVSSTVTLSLPGPVLWAGMYWGWAGRADAAPIDLAGPCCSGVRISAADSGGQGGVHQAFANVTGEVTTGGAWTARVPTLRGARYLGWALVVIAADPAVSAGQVMVLDGAHLVSPSGPAFVVPMEGLLPVNKIAGVQLVTWQVTGGAASAVFTEPPGIARSVRFTPGSQPYMAGVLVVTEPPDGQEYAERQSRAADFTTLGVRGHSRLASGSRADLHVSPAEWKDGVAWIVARCSLTRAMSWRTAQWPCTGRAAASRFRGTTGVCCSSSRALPGSARTFPCCVVTGTRRRSKAAVRPTTTH
jgi:RNA polymerase sigma factor (sigma-70 family)